MSLFYKLLIAHFLGDYVFRSNYLSLMKRNEDIFDMVFANLFHSVIHFGFVLFIFISFRVDLIITVNVSVMILLFHFTIDFIRCFLERKYKVWNEGLITIFRAVYSDFSAVWKYKGTIIRGVIDQIVHLGSLIVIAFVLV